MTLTERDIDYLLSSDTRLSQAILDNTLVDSLKVRVHWTVLLNAYTLDWLEIHLIIGGNMIAEA